MGADGPLHVTPRESSANGNTPQAPEASQAAGADLPTRISGETWGPGAWGPGAPPIDLTPGPADVGRLPLIVEQPPVLREYGIGARPRPAVPYRPPIGPAGPAGAPMYPPGAPTYRGYPPQPGYGLYPPYLGAPVSPYGWHSPLTPPHAPGETYHKVLSILTIVAASLLILSGLGGLGVLGLLALAGNGQDLASINLILMVSLVALLGGSAGLYHAIRALMRRASAPFSLPSFWLLLIVTVVALGAGIALFALRKPTGPVVLIEPLVLLSGMAPAFTILALALQRLGGNVSWRRAALALTSGATLSIGVASLLELALALLLIGIASTSSLDPSTFTPDNPTVVVGTLVLVAVIAPLAEETTKQIAGFFLLPRMKGPQVAFLIGLASGIGFAIVETAGYIGTAQADWVGIALGRVGGGLLHGIGAAMAGVGWYYIFRGKGVLGRWRLGIGFLAYAYLQHAIFNGGQVLLLLIKPLQTWHVDFVDLHLDATSVYAALLYLIILGVLLQVTRWLRGSAPSAGSHRETGQPIPRVSMAVLSVAPGAGAPTMQHSPPAANTSPSAGTSESGSAEWGSREPGGRI